MKIAIVLLAAGASKRLGRPKQTVIFDGKTLVRRAAESALAMTENVVVVLGAHFDTIRPELDGLSLEILKNDGWAEGMAASMRLGLAFLIEKISGLEAVIFSVVDQPMLGPTAFENLILEQKNSEKGIVSSDFGRNQTGPPVLFCRPFFDELLKLTGDEGAKKVVLKNWREAAFVPFLGGDWDIDRAEDLEKMG